MLYSVVVPTRDKRAYLAATLPAPAVDAVRRALTCYETQTATVDYHALLAELRESRAHALGHPAPARSPGEWGAFTPPPRWAEAYQILRSPSEIAAYLAEAERAAPVTTLDGSHADGPHAV